MAEEALKELEKLLGTEDSQTNTTIRSEINDIESKEQTELDKFRLKNLKHLASQAVNIIADSDYEILLAKMKGPVSGKTKLLGGEDNFWEDIKRRVNEVKTDYDEGKRRQKQLQIGKTDGRPRQQGNPSALAPTGSLSIEPHIFGRNDYVDDIIKKIDREEYVDDIIKKIYREEVVFPIVGSPGIGKTTLIQHVCGRDIVKNCFDKMGWVFVPQSFDELKLTQAVFESITGTVSSSDRLDHAQTELVGELKGNRCLLVLDDVWHSKEEFWRKFWDPLIPVLQRSIVFVITRDITVLDAMPRNIARFDPIVLERLFYEDSRSLFYQVLEEGHPELEKNVKDIIRRCKGVPSALKRAAFTFARDNGWNLRHQAAFQCEISKLKSSYRRLPAPLKHCVSYCSLFPENYEFNKDFLIRLWIAEGFIVPKGEKELEDIGAEYFDALWSRSFFQLQDNDMYVMPIFLQSAPEYCTTTDSSNTLKTCSSDVRYASHVAHNYREKRKEIECVPLSGGNSLSTFLVIYPEEDKINIEYPMLKVDLSTLSKMKYLRSLDLSCTLLEELPDSVGEDLKHLHFLGLNGTRIKILPDSICRLYNLQTLELRNCRRLKELPKDMSNMIKLRHLDLDTEFRSYMMAGIGELTELRTLHRFNVGRADGFAGIRELEKLGNLAGAFCISSLCNVASFSDCEVARLESKQLIQKLTLAWPSDVDEVKDEELTDNDDYVDYTNETQDTMEEVNLKDGEAATKAPDVGDPMKADRSNEDNFTVYDQINTAIKPEESKFLSMESIEEASIMNSTLSILVEENNKILKGLRPHDGIKILIIQSYNGSALPDWMGSDSLEVTTVALEDCTNCVSLPSFGLLPSLEYLAIDHMPVQSIGTEFCGVSKEHPGECFPKLDELALKDLHKLEEWSGVRKNDFPKIQKITFFNCWELKQIPSFAFLRALEMENCNALKSLPEFPVLKTLRLISCDGLENLPNLDHLSDLTVMFCAGLTTLPKLQKLNKLWLEDCEKLTSIGLLCNCSSTMLMEKLKDFSKFLVMNCPVLQFSSFKLPKYINLDSLKRRLKNLEQATTS